MLGHIDRLTVILDGEAVGIAEDIDLLDWVLRVLAAEADGMIVSVDQELVDQLVESRVDGDGLGLEGTGYIVKEDLLIRSLDATHVGVGKGEDMLTVRLALVGRKVRHLGETVLVLVGFFSF
jgi:hypothetical protein